MATRRALPVVLVTTVLLLAAACGSDAGDSSAADGAEGGSASADGDTPSAEAGSVDVAGSVDFVAPTLDGGELDAAELAGAPTVLWFWAPWCTTCRSEAPNVTAVAEAFDGEVRFIGVAGRGEVVDMERFVSETGTEALAHIVDEGGTIWSDFGVFSQPAFAFLAADGSVETTIGALGEAQLAEMTAELAYTAQ